MSDLAGAISVRLRSGLDGGGWMIVQVLVKGDGHGFSEGGCGRLGGQKSNDACCPLIQVQG